MSTAPSEPPFLSPLSPLAEITTRGVSAISLVYTAVHATSGDCGSPPQPFHAPKPLQATRTSCKDHHMHNNNYDEELKQAKQRMQNEEKAQRKAKRKKPEEIT
eukprot:scaffold171501_cov35-Attheya_sp.AAC.1